MPATSTTLYRLAHARTGDKGNRVNISLIAYDAADWRLLVEQVTARVRWRETIASLRDRGITSVVEVGTGKALTGMAKRIDKELQALSIETPQEIEAFIKAL